MKTISEGQVSGLFNSKSVIITEQLPVHRHESQSELQRLHTF